MRNILSGGRGMAGLVLVILIAWALLSVMFLTGTLLAARSIDRSVNDTKTGINPVVQNIGKNAEDIDEARVISITAKQILAAAAPLSDQLTVIEKVARSQIDPNLKRILGKVGQINEVAGSINANVLQIGSTVDSILGSATSINGSVQSINAKGRTILRSASQINGSARAINGDLGTILSLVNTIDGKVARANAQAKEIDDVANPIEADFQGIIDNVGKDNTDKIPGTINFHANNIDCSILVNNPAGLSPNVLTPLLGLLTGLGLAPPAAQASIACVP